MRFLVTGAAGSLGSRLTSLLVERGDEVVATTHHTPVQTPRVRQVQVDLSTGDGLARLVQDARPDVLINTAYAYADWSATAVAPVLLAQAAQQFGAHVVQLSTDAVFSGRAAAYVESDPPDPLIPYGAAKAAAEVGVRAVAPEATIIRTTLIMGHRAAPMETLPRALVTGERDGVLFTDDVRCPVHVDDLAAATLELADARRAGMFHVGGPDALSRYEIGVRVCERAGLSPARLRTGLRADLALPGALDLRLDSTRTQRLLSVRLRGAREFLA